MLDDLEEAQDSVEMGSGYLMCLVETNHNDKKTSDKVKRTFGLVASIFVIKVPVDTVQQSFSCCLYWILEKKCLIQMNKNISRQLPRSGLCQVYQTTEQNNPLSFSYDQKNSKQKLTCSECQWLFRGLFCLLCIKINEFEKWLSKNRFQDNLVSVQPPFKESKFSIKLPIVCSQFAH